MVYVSPYKTTAQKAADRAAANPSIANALKPHAHGCVTCKARYEDSCTSPNGNATCSRCRSANTGWDLLFNNRLPRDCCRLHSRAVVPDEIKLYRLSTGCGWAICTVCARTFPYRNPTLSQENR